MSKKPSILFIHTLGGGIGYYRMHTPARALHRAGYPVTYNLDELSFFNGLKEMGLDIAQWLQDEGSKHDIIHMGYSTMLEQVTTINGALRNYILQEHKREVPVVVDMDDDPHSVPSYNTAYKAFHRTAGEKKNLLIHLHTADALTTTRETCKKALWRDSKHTYVLPNCTWPGDWQHLPRDPRRHDDKSVRLMFAGGHGHYGDLLVVKDAVTTLMEKYNGKGGRPMLRLFFLGCTPDWVEGWFKDTKNAHRNRCFYFHPAPISTYFKALRWVQPDIMIAPVEENTFNESKTEVKAIDCGVAGGALVCSDWATYDSVPQEVCLKASSPAQWKASLEYLIEDKGARANLASNLTEWVLAERDIDKYIHLWGDAYADVCSRPIIKDLGDTVRPRIITGDDI